MSESPLVAPEVPLSEQQGETFPHLVRVMQRLLAPDGCPWDREQTEDTLKRYVLEEACEVIDAIETGEPRALCDELGDLSLQIVFLAELGRKKGQFGPDDVVRAITEKLVRRHPHVFGDVHVDDADDVVRNWDAIKKTERGERPLLESVPRSLPSLQRAQRISEKVAKVGFDWPSAEGSRAKVTEELGELDETIRERDVCRIEEELGDVLFALVNLARHLGVDADAALRGTCNRFAKRFGNVEERVVEKRGAWPPSDGEKIPLAELDEYWEAAKLEET